MREIVICLQTLRRICLLKVKIEPIYKAFMAAPIALKLYA